MTLINTVKVGEACLGKQDLVLKSKTRKAEANLKVVIRRFKDPKFDFGKVYELTTETPAILHIAGACILLQNRIKETPSYLAKESELENLRKLIQFSYLENTADGIKLTHSGLISVWALLSFRV